MPQETGEKYLFPASVAYDQGYMDAGDGHQIYYWKYGNPDGWPIFFLHGGPGGGCEAWHHRLFDPNKWNIILHDQRGCGKSLPTNELKHNTTQDLIGDVFRLRTRLLASVLMKPVLFGGSWASALACLTAQANPEAFAGLVLRGIFLATQREWRELYITEHFFPEAYKRYISLVPVEHRGNSTGYYLRQILSTDKNIAAKYAYESNRFDESIYRLDPLTEEQLEQTLSNSDSLYTYALIPNYYFSSENHCFIEEDQIINNAHKIRHLPICIVQGRYDATCPQKNARMLADALELPKEQLRLVVGGHHALDPEITRGLVEITNEWMYNKLTKGV